MATLTSNSSDAFLHNLTHLRNQRDNTPNSSNSAKNEEIVLLEKQGRSSQKLRSNLAQVSSTIGQNMSDISNIGQPSGSSKVRPKNHKIIINDAIQNIFSFQKLFYHLEKIDSHRRRHPLYLVHLEP